MGWQKSKLSNYALVLLKFFYWISFSHKRHCQWCWPQILFSHTTKVSLKKIQIVTGGNICVTEHFGKYCWCRQNQGKRSTKGPPSMQATHKLSYKILCVYFLSYQKEHSAAASATVCITLQRSCVWLWRCKLYIHTRVDTYDYVE